MALFHAILLAAAVFAVAYFGTDGVRAYARRRLLDVPNERSSHQAPTPRGGGLAIVVAFGAGMGLLFAIGLLDLPIAWAMLGGVLVAGIGFWDDHGHVSARLRMAAHVLAAIWAVYWLGGFDVLSLNGQPIRLGGFGAAAAVLLIVWVLNLFNFMDGIDGIAASETSFVSAAALSMAYLSVGKLHGDAMAMALLAMASAGFLVWNWPPAKIFMGDVGSGFVGFMLGLLMLWSAQRGSVSLVVWLILGAVFFVDATWTLLRRMLGGQRWYAAHRSHGYQQATRLLGRHGPVTAAVLLIDALWLLPLGFAATHWPERELWLLAVAYLPLCGLAGWLGAGRAA